MTIFSFLPRSPYEIGTAGISQGKSAKNEKFELIINEIDKTYDKINEDLEINFDKEIKDLDKEFEDKKIVINNEIKKI